MSNMPYSERRTRHGIVGIERQLEQRNEQTARTIDQGFEDLSNLMKLAKDMVSLSKRISEVVQAKTGSISDDETVQFKSYLLSLGVDDPVTREGSKSMYFVDLAKELAKVLERPIKETGGIMTLSDAYCRINRARGMELLSPADMMDACLLLERLRLPVKLIKFRSGVVALQATDFDENEAVERTMQLIEDNKCLSPQNCARLLGISVLLATERLQTAEQQGLLCRDDSIEGLFFYKNLFNVVK